MLEMGSFKRILFVVSESLPLFNSEISELTQMTLCTKLDTLLSYGTGPRWRSLPFELNQGYISQNK
jgi:hypothetical protein